MNRRRLLKSLAGLALCPLCAPTGFAAEGEHWGYQGGQGPDKWGELDDANRACSIGSQQSPIDIGETIKSKLPRLKIAWAKRAESIVNNGHTIQVNMTAGSVLAVAKENYALQQFHFHRPSEHLIGGKAFPMEVRFVHRNAAGGLAVVGVLMQTGRANRVFAKVTATMPTSAGPAMSADAGIDPNGLLPARRSYYRYSGSLTTPPCSETVEWLLLTEPTRVAAADVEKFAQLYPLNARPAQKPNRRFVLRSA